MDHAALEIGLAVGDAHGVAGVGIPVGFQPDHVAQAHPTGRTRQRGEAALPPGVMLVQIIGWDGSLADLSARRRGEQQQEQPKEGVHMQKIPSSPEAPCQEPAFLLSLRHIDDADLGGAGGHGGVPERSHM